MTINAKFSPSTGGIYPTAAYKTFPDDALDIPNELYDRFSSGEVSALSVVNNIVVEKPLVAPTIDELKEAKFTEVRTAYDAAALQPVEVLGFTWDGGFDSAIKLDAAKRLSEAANASGVRFYDTSNIGHDLNFTDALSVCIAVAVAFQTVLAKKQALFGQINAATTIPQVDAISW